VENPGQENPGEPGEPGTGDSTLKYDFMKCSAGGRHSYSMFRGGLKGTYKIDLRWDVDYDDNTDGGRGDRATLTVLDQLGLKLEKRKVQVSILVIDHVERTPTPN
jgi:hypothetical protein